MLVALFVTMATQASSGDATPVGDADIVVIGKRLVDASNELANCIKRKCPTDQDVAATIKVVEMQFLAAEYRSARETLRRSISRNRGQAKAYPLPVASLWRAKSKVEGHLGDYEGLRSGVLQSHQVLKAGLSADDPNLLGSLIELGDAQFHLGYWTFAEEHYRDAIARAERANVLSIAAIARYRLAGVIARRDPNGPTIGDEKEVARVLAPLIGSTEPVYTRYDFIARLYKARLAERRGAKGAVDAVFASLPKGITPPPILLSSTPIKLPAYGKSDCVNEIFNATALTCGDARNYVSNLQLEGQWIDVSFLIAPTGDVRDVDIVRKSPKYKGTWSDYVTRSIASRRYSAVPAPKEGDAAGRYRVERFTLTAPYVDVTGTRLRVRDANVTVETLDLTPG